MTMRIGVLVSVLLLAGEGARAADMAHGKELVTANCARCHGVGTDDKSTHKDAPEFRFLSERYPIEALEEAFAEGIVTGHPDMPEFEATPSQIADIVAYIESIQNPQE